MAFPTRSAYALASLACLLMCVACGSGADNGAKGDGGSQGPACNDQYPLCQGFASPTAPSSVTAKGTFATDSFDVTCDFTGKSGVTSNWAQYCRWDLANLPDELQIYCEPATGAYWNEIGIVLRGMKGPGTYKSTFPDDSPPYFEIYLDGSTTNDLYAVTATLDLQTFDLCKHKAKGTISAKQDAQKGLSGGTAQLTFDVSF